MKRALIFNLVLLLTASSFFAGMVHYGTTKDRELIGVWKESEWKYEKVDAYNENGGVNDVRISDELKNEIAKDLIIHQSEVWEFLPENKLRIRMETGEDLMMDYKLKGRGHILKIIHDDKVLEHYTIQQVTRDQLVLNFYVETQARGIVKLSFERI